MLVLMGVGAVRRIEGTSEAGHCILGTEVRMLVQALGQTWASALLIQ